MQYGNRHQPYSLPTPKVVVYTLLPIPQEPVIFKEFLTMTMGTPASAVIILK